MLAAEAYLCLHLQVMLQAASSKATPVRAAAEAAVLAVTSKMSANAVREVLQHLFVASAVGQQFQTRALALKVISAFADHAPEQLGFALPDVSRYVLFLS